MLESNAFERKSGFNVSQFDTIATVKLDFSFARSRALYGIRPCYFGQRQTKQQSPAWPYLTSASDLRGGGEGFDPPPHET